jgi:pilus assembly protein TadC
MTIVLALSAATGVFLFFDALRARAPRVRLTADDNRPFTQRLLDTLFAPAAQRVMGLSRTNLADHKLDLQRRLQRADFPSPFRTPEIVMSYRLFTAILFALMGGVFGLLIGLGPALVPLMLGLAVFGWAMPDRTIANTERDRREQLTIDAASTLDRLAIFTSAGNALPSAIQSVAAKPGGAWVAEFRQFTALYVFGSNSQSSTREAAGSFATSADYRISQNGRLPEITRVWERLKAAQEMGGGHLSRALQQMAADARTTIKLLITERGYRNAVLMVIPAFFAIIAIMIVLIAPAAVKMVGVLGG